MPHETRESWHDKSSVERTTQLRTDVVHGLTSRKETLHSPVLITVHD